LATLLHSTPPRRKLIVNADDYALTEGVSRGILKAAHQGIVTSTSVLAVGPAFDRAAQWLADTAGIGVGVHFALVGEDPPLLPASEIPTLVDPRGRFPRTWRAFSARAALGRIDPADVARELRTQLERVGAIGHPIGHLDAHQHLQLYPLIGETVVALATRFRVRAIRVPGVSAAHPLSVPVALLSSRLRRAATARGLLVADRSVGIDVAGRLERARLRAPLLRLAGTPARVVELTVHPGEALDPQRARYDWGYRWPEELEALTDVTTRRLVDRLGFELATYATARAERAPTRDGVAARVPPGRDAGPRSLPTAPATRRPTPD
jgi:predicted glycoside hydrolase/deacetylase ChbG (UPF0249 family)